MNVVHSTTQKRWITRCLVTVLLCLLAVSVASAQDEVAPEATPEPLPIAPQVVEIDALDGLDLTADFYLVDPARPTVILIHEMYTDRTSWDPLLLPLLANAYNILVPDVRGWGDTRGAINWYSAVEDVSVWFTWLRETAGVNPEAIHTVGSSMGSSLAINGCANDEFCRSSVAISPGWRYYGISVQDTIATKQTLVIYAERDRWPALGVPDMVEAAPETLTVITYPGNAHGMDLFEDEQETVVVQILEWLNTH
ncbi:MAG: alpha/beta fold hydrolase [Chloroflexota bacterium]